jgi:hypothetical protein
VRYINNHVTLTIFYHADEKQSEGEDKQHLYRVVGFEVEPVSVKHVIDGKWTEPDNSDASLASKNNKLSTCDRKRPAGEPFPRCNYIIHLHPPSIHYSLI